MSRKFLKKKDYRPKSVAGNLYYVRLKTPLGLMYKLGYTSLDSVIDRLAFQENGDNLLLDETLLFLRFDNAWEIEQVIHRYYKSYALFSGLDETKPLFKNGQSELYAKDILDLDRGYSEEQSQKTEINILAFNFGRTAGVSAENVKNFVMLMEKKHADVRRDAAIHKDELENFKKNRPLLAILLKALYFPFSMAFKYSLKMFKYLFHPNTSEAKELIRMVRLKVRIERYKEMEKYIAELSR